jgi:hypothetical protein
MDPEPVNLAVSHMVADWTFFGSGAAPLAL